MRSKHAQDRQLDGEERKRKGDASADILYEAFDEELERRRDIEPERPAGEEGTGGRRTRAASTAALSDHGVVGDDLFSRLLVADLTRKRFRGSVRPVQILGVRAGECVTSHSKMGGGLYV